MPYTAISERPLWRVLLAMERRGFRVDLQQPATEQRGLWRKVAQIEAEVVEMVGIPFNLNSTKQWARCSLDELKLPVIKKTNQAIPSMWPYWSSSPVRESHCGFDAGVPKAAPNSNPLISTALQAAGRCAGRGPTRLLVKCDGHRPYLLHGAHSRTSPFAPKWGRRFRRAFVPSAPGRVLAAADYFTD